jgi:hypothetical protein
MTRSHWAVLVLSGISVGSGALGCAPGGVGDPCIPEDEYSEKFNGFGVAEANVESRSFQCETRVCIVNHFQGRVSCPYGQTAEEAAGTSTPAHGRCMIPASALPVTAAVEAQLLNRRADETVYCSCRCKGEDTSAKYCSCPSGYTCSPLVPDLGLGKANLAGSYCLKNGTDWDGQSNGAKCGSKPNDCGPGNPQ